MKKNYNLFGIVLLLLGFIFLFKFPAFGGYTLLEKALSVWPLLLMIAGGLILIRLYKIGIVLFLFVIIVALFSFQITLDEWREVNEFSDTFELPGAVHSMNLYLGNTAGTLTILPADDHVFSREISTISNSEPAFREAQELKHMDFWLERLEDTDLIYQHQEEWNLAVPKISQNIAINYGAADVNLDLESLPVQELHIDSRALNGVITLGKMNSKVFIDMDLGELLFHFPEEVGVRVEVENSLMVSLEGFDRQENVYVNEWYDANGQNIEMFIDAGAGTIKSENYYSFE